MSLPGLTIKESVAPIFSTGNGGKTIAVIGSTNTKEEVGVNELYTFYNFNSAYEKYHQKEDGKEYNPLLKAVYDVFREAETREITHSLGIDRIYAINTGHAPNVETYKGILEILRNERNIDIEAYIGLSDVPILSSIKQHLELLAKDGDYRIAIATTPPKSKIETIKEMTTKDGGICSSRVVLHNNPSMVAAFAGKVACTPYFEDPSKGGYRSKTLQEVETRPRNEIEDLLEGGVVCDWDSYEPGGKHVLEPCMAIATSHSGSIEGRPADCFLHHRLNADHQARVTDQYLRGFLKQNNSDIMRQSAESKCKDYLSNEVRKGFLENYDFHLTIDKNDPTTLIVDMRITPVASIHHIVLNRAISPTREGCRV